MWRPISNFANSTIIIALSIVITLVCTAATGEEDQQSPLSQKLAGTCRIDVEWNTTAVYTYRSDCVGLYRI